MSKSTLKFNSTPTSTESATSVVTRKYTAKTAKLGGVGIIPAFKYSELALFCNTAANTAPQKPTTVMGKVYELVRKSPGITGKELVAAMRAMRWEGHPSAYVRGNGGEVCALWCIGYVVGAVSNKHRHLVAKQVVKETASA